MGFLTAFVQSDRAGREQILRQMESAVGQMGTLGQLGTMRERLEMERLAAPGQRRLTAAQAGSFEEKTAGSLETRERWSEARDFLAKKYGLPPEQLEADVKMMGLAEAVKKYEARETANIVPLEVEGKVAKEEAGIAEAGLAKVTAEAKEELVPAATTAKLEQMKADTAKAQEEALKSSVATSILQFRSSKPGYIQSVAEREADMYGLDKQLKLAQVSRFAAAASLDKAKAAQLQAIIDNPELEGDIDDQIKRWQHGADLMLERKFADAGFDKPEARNLAQERPRISELVKEIKSLEAIKESVVEAGDAWGDMVGKVIRSAKIPDTAKASVESAKTLEEFQASMDVLINFNKARLAMYYSLDLGHGMASPATLAEQAQNEIFGARQGLREELAK